MVNQRCIPHIYGLIRDDYIRLIGQTKHVQTNINKCQGFKARIAEAKRGPKIDRRDLQRREVQLDASLKFKEIHHSKTNERVKHGTILL